LDEERTHAMVEELGDILWYMAQIASECEIDVEEAVKRNSEKIYSRYPYYVFTA